MVKNQFVLIHGASYGAWCWYKVSTLLKSAGHDVTALDMASCGINTTSPRYFFNIFVNLHGVINDSIISKGR